MVQRSDQLQMTLRQKDFRYLAPALTDLAARPDIVSTVDGVERGLDVLGRIVGVG